MALKVLHLSTYATNGGAARAASALNRAMQQQGIDSRLITAHGPRFAAARTLDRQLWRLQRSPTQTWRSPARFASLTASEINQSSADVINLHWVTDGFLSIEEIGKITKPMVWSMYDMWPFTGTEHYGADTPDARWRTGYTTDNRPTDESGLDIDRWTYERKERLWRQHPPIHMVPASSWLEDATKASALMHDWPVTRIPHVIDTEVFTPMDAVAARKLLGLPQAPTITFLASAGIDDARKGWDLLEQALPIAKERHPTLQVIVVGPLPDEARRRQAEQVAQVPIHWHGMANDSSELRVLYAAGDVTAVPSRDDNMPLTAMEAQTCGRPVVGFAIGGLPDIVDHGRTGWLAGPGESAGLAGTLSRALSSQTAGDAALTRAHETWSPSAVIPVYRHVYETVMTPRGGL